MRVSQIKNRDTLIAQLQEAIHENPEGHYQHRLHVVLLVLQFQNVHYAATLYQEPKRTIQYWMQQFLSAGMDGLRDKPRSGRPSQLTASQKATIQKILENPPRYVGYERNDWDGKLLSHYIAKQFHLNLKVRRCQYLFHELGFTLQRTRSAANGDPIVQAEFQKKPKKSWQK
jgi:transposase